VSLCLTPDCHDWLSEKFAKVMVIGGVELMSTDERSSTQNGSLRGGDSGIDRTVIIRALLVEYIPELDLKLWNESILEMQDL
jgi:hypothetical protein